MAELKIRKHLVSVEEILHEGGPAAAQPQRRGAALTVISNPFAGAYHEDIEFFMDVLKPLGTTAPGSHQRAPKRRMPNTSTAPPSAAKPAAMACDFATSPRPAGPVLRDEPDVLGPLARDGGERQRRRRPSPARSPRPPRRPRAGGGGTPRAAPAGGGRSPRARRARSPSGPRRSTAGRSGRPPPSRSAPR